MGALGICEAVGPAVQSRSDFWRDRATMWGASLTDTTEELVHAKRHIAQQEQEVQRLELELLQSKKDGATSAKKRRRQDKKVKFDEDVVEAAAEMASERADRMWQVDNDPQNRGVTTEVN